MAIRKVAKVSLNPVEALIKTQARQMRQRFEESSIKFKNTLNIARKRELTLSNFLEDYLQPGYRTGNGEIIDQQGNQSGQVDVIVRNPFHPVSKSVGEEPELFFAEGVFCAIDVKSMLNKTELERGLAQIRSIKRLTRNIPDGSQLLGHTPYDTRMVEKIHCGLFAYNSPSIPTLKATIDGIHAKNGVKAEEQFDMVAILDKGIIINRKDPGDAREVNTQMGKALGVIGILDSDGDTLQRFLWHLSSLPDIMTIGRPIIMDYLKFLQTRKVKVVADKYA